jgi:hypothetical protein
MISTARAALALIDVDEGNSSSVAIIKNALHALMMRTIALEVE